MNGNTTVSRFLLVDKVVDFAEPNLNQRVRTTARAMAPINAPRIRPLIPADHGVEVKRAGLLYHSKTRKAVVYVISNKLYLD